MSLLDNFLTYVKIDTQSSEEVATNPTTAKQFNLGNLLVEELHKMGIVDAFIDEHCYVYAYIPSNTACHKTIGLIAHMDTALEMPGKNVNPQVIKKYNGNDIILNNEKNIIMKVKDFPSLKGVIGHTIITTDGTTLLGADDKAGVAIIMEVLHLITKNHKLPHPNIIITFTPDEEVGMGTNSFNYNYYKEHHCSMAYTLDGGDVNVINYENFNAASASIEIFGKSIHPGSAKGKMVNSILVAMEFQSMLPQDLLPEKTEKYEGFNHLNDVEGSVEHTSLHYIIRNHNMELFRKQIADFYQITDELNKKYGEGTIKTTITDSYYNMKDLILEHHEILDYAVKALSNNGLNPTFDPIRGGTDGARLSFEGILTPNLGTGGENYHGKYEYVSLNNMEKMVNVVLELLKIISFNE